MGASDNLILCRPQRTLPTWTDLKEIFCEVGAKNHEPTSLKKYSKLLGCNDNMVKMADIFILLLWYILKYRVLCILNSASQFGSTTF